MRYYFQHYGHNGLHLNSVMGAENIPAGRVRDFKIIICG
jgi:hypothetical protein